MLKLTDKKLSVATRDTLFIKQAFFNLKHQSFQERSSNTTAEWNARKRGMGTVAFNEIVTKLKEMAVKNCICNYCENNRGLEIEHIYPKSHFPERLFSWENYLWACKECNLTIKSDKFAIFSPAGSSTKSEIPRQGRTLKIAPKNEDACIIDPRVDDPLDYLFLILKLGRFAIHPNLPVDSRDYQKAAYTLDTMLELNSRNEVLNKARVAAFDLYFARLKSYIAIKNANSFTQLDAAIRAFRAVNILHFTNDLNVEKITRLAGIKKSIIEQDNPTVWKEMIRQRDRYPDLKALFDQAFEALEW